MQLESDTRILHVMHGQEARATSPNGITTDGCYNWPMHKLITIALFALLVTVMAQRGSCSSGKTKSEISIPTRTDKPAQGTWGGEHIQAEITDGGAQFEFDCANGAITKPIVLDNQGRFNVTGTFATEHPGPVRRDEDSNARSVRYAGRVKDQEMTLTITDPATKEVIGTFTLKHGNEGRIMKCR